MTLQGRLRLPPSQPATNGIRERPSQRWQRHSAVDLLRLRQLRIAAEEADRAEIDEMTRDAWVELRDLLLRLTQS